MTRTVSSTMKIFTLIGTVLAGLLFLQTEFVGASDYQEDRLAILLTLMSLDLKTVENSIENSRRYNNIQRTSRLERERSDLENQRRDIRKRQLEL